LTRRHRWNFAIKRVALPAEVATPVWGPTRSFPKPVDCLRVLEVNGFPEFRIEGDAIVTDQAAPLELRYVARIEDPNLFDVTFAAALAAHLALEICEDVTQSNSKFERMKAWAAETLREAKRLDAIEEPPETLPDEEDPGIDRLTAGHDLFAAVMERARPGRDSWLLRTMAVATVALLAFAMPFSWVGGVTSQRNGTGAVSLQAATQPRKLGSDALPLAALALDRGERALVDRAIAQLRENLGRVVTALGGDDDVAALELLDVERVLQRRLVLCHGRGTATGIAGGEEQRLEQVEVADG